ncbi:lyase family protein [Paragemmobacter straminiformis]|uniref:Adenylosuccinate lyase family protein n=1 Tax=Paragemmobacter straminiformis TaxID=2045119 RepID=A0A842IAP7_9RHOB|nr:lyase family protein [Gemmobacter straminiformis]MBC2836417.1 adenylosuccinate lyase family protein [Gemmobacter straminiformis]
MPASPADSAIYRQLFSDDEGARLFSDSAELRAMLIVEAALAKVQGETGLIPPEAAAFIARAAHEVQIDPAGLAAETGVNGVPVPAFLAAFRKAAEAPDLMQYLHWGATSQDIMDTALALRLRRMLELWQARLDAVLQRLGRLARDHADLPMAGRTFGQAATPVSFGAVVAAWGWPLLGWRDGFDPLRAAVLNVSLSGAAGTLSAMGEAGPEVRARLAEALGLADPGHSWHSDRSGMARLAGFAAGLAGSLGKMGEDVILLAQSGLAEVSLGGGGSSSTMPQKRNPVAPSVLVALSRQVIGLAATMQGAGLHRQQRDGAAWFTEWLTLPQMCISTGKMLALAEGMLAGLTPDGEAMRVQLDGGLGLIHAEALAFALAARLPRPEAQAEVKALCARALDSGLPLAALVAERFPDGDWAALFGAGGLGQAPAEARAFAARLGH